MSFFLVILKEGQFFIELIDSFLVLNFLFRVSFFFIFNLSVELLYFEFEGLYLFMKVLGLFFLNCEFRKKLFVFLF